MVARRRRAGDLESTKRKLFGNTTVGRGST